MSNLVRRAARRLYPRLRAPGKHVHVRPDDVFLVSYPRSGNMWARFLLGNLVSDEPIDFRNVRRAVPNIYQESRRVLDGVTGRRFLKSHEPYDARYPCVIYLVRDPRDVLVSYFWYHVRAGFISPDHSIDEFAGRFLEGQADGFGPWGDHVAGWLDASGVLVVRYEDLQADTAGALLRIAKHAGIPYRDEEVAAAVELSSFDAMQVAEETTATWSNAGSSTLNLRHVRSGRVGGWRESLPSEVAEQVAVRWGGQMERMGYSP